MAPTNVVIATPKNFTYPNSPIESNVFTFEIPQWLALYSMTLKSHKLTASKQNNDFFKNLIYPLRAFYFYFFISKNTKLLYYLFIYCIFSHEVETLTLSNFFHIINFLGKLQFIHLWFNQNLRCLYIIWNLILYSPEIRSVRFL